MLEDISENNFDEKVIAASMPVLVDFWAPWCGPCRAIAPRIAELAEEFAGKLVCYKLNVDESPTIPGRLGFRTIPIIMVFKDGEVVEQLAGEANKSELKEMVEKVLG